MCDSDIGEATLKITGVTTEDDGVYTCIAVNDMGSASSSASLRVLGKPPLGHTTSASLLLKASILATLGVARSLEQKGACVNVQKRLK